MLDLGAQIELVPPAESLPDLVFTANAAVVMNGKALLARFRHPERQAEEPHYEAAFPHAQRPRTDPIHREACPRTSCSKAPATASGTRCATSSGWATARAPISARSMSSKKNSARTSTALELADPRFYHMDYGAASAARRRGHVLSGTPSPRRAAPSFASRSHPINGSEPNSTTPAGSRPMRSRSVEQSRFPIAAANGVRVMEAGYRVVSDAARNHSCAAAAAPSALRSGSITIQRQSRQRSSSRHKNVPRNRPRRLVPWRASPEHRHRYLRRDVPLGPLARAWPMRWSLSIRYTPS